ncbi:MAG: alpha/beta hydrolase [Actinomycetota bacterium]
MAADRLDDLLDADHRRVLRTLPPELLNPHEVPEARHRFQEYLNALAGQGPPEPPPTDVVTVSEALAPPVVADQAPVRVKVYRPVVAPERRSGLLVWIHGGGMVLGTADYDDTRCGAMVAALGVTIVSVDYRLAPEHPYPAAVDDCMAALAWAVAEADALAVDPERIAVGGASAGGGLAAAVALRARDEGGPALCYQHLVYPMLDDRQITPSSHAITDARVWNRTSNAAAWAVYLADLPTGSEVPPYAAPARAVDLAGLPPAFIPVGQFDLFLDENIDYATRLLQAGVPVELRVYPGAFHGSDGLVPDSPVTIRWLADELDSLRRALT